MGSTATVSSKGQLTIPKRFRDRLGIRAGTVVEFREEGSSLVIGKARTEDPVTAVFGVISGVGMESDEVVAALRGTSSRKRLR